MHEHKKLQSLAGFPLLRPPLLSLYNTHTQRHVREKPNTQNQYHYLNTYYY